MDVTGIFLRMERRRPQSNWLIFALVYDWETLQRDGFLDFTLAREITS